MDSPDRSEKLVKRSNKTMDRLRQTEALHKISDGRPIPVTPCETETIDVSSDESNHSVKIEDTSPEMTFNNDKTSAAMTLLNLYPQGEDPQEEPLDLSNKTLLRKFNRSKEFLMLEKYDSAERCVNKNISSESDKSSRSVQTTTTTGSTCGAPKQRLSYEARSKTNPYPVIIPSKVNIPGIGFVSGIFVPVKGLPSRICRTEVSLTDPSEGKEQLFLDLVESKQPTALGHKDYQHPPISSTVSSHACKSPNPDGFHLYMSSASFNSGQAFIAPTSSDYYRTDTPSPPDITQLSADRKTFRSLAESSKSLTPDCHQPERTDIDVQISKCIEPLSAVKSEQHSSIFQSEEESQLSVAMDTGNSICLPNIPFLHENVKEWTQTEHEALKKRLNKKIRGRTETPD